MTRKLRVAAALFCLVAGTGAHASAGSYDLSMPVRTGDVIDGHNVWGPEGLGPDSLTDLGEVAFLDIYVGSLPQQGAATSLRRLADLGETIDGYVVSELKAGFQIALDGAGSAAFQALSSGVGDQLFGIPDFASPNLAAGAGAASVSAASHPAANEAGDFVFALNWCTPSVCPRRWLFDPSGVVLADEISVDGFTISDFDVPALNEQGDVAFVAGHLDGSRRRGVYLWDGATVTTLLRDGAVLANGTLGANCCPNGIDLDDAGRAAVIWPDSGGTRVLVVGNAIALRPGDTVEGHPVGFLADTAIPTLNGAGDWAVAATLDGGSADLAIVASGPALVARTGDVVANEAIERLWAPSVNEVGQIAFQASLGPGTFSPRAIVLATPSAANSRARLRASSSAFIRQSATAPAGATDVRFGFRFETAAGTLTVRFAGQSLGSFTAPATPAQSFARGRLRVDGALLGQTGDLEFSLEGPAGASVVLDDVVFPGVENGDFRGSAAGWVAQGDVSVVPEPAAGACAALAALALLGVRRAAEHSKSSRGFGPITGSMSIPR